MVAVGLSCGGCLSCEDCQIVDDDFNRSDNTNIDTGSAAGWTEFSGAWAISSNQLVATSAGQVFCTTEHPDGRQTVFVEVDFKHSNSGGSCQVIIARVDSDTWYYAKYHIGTNQIQIGIYDGGEFPQRTVSQVMATNTTYRAKVCITPDGVITAYLDGVAKASHYWGNPVTGKVGLASTGSGTATFDNFSLSKAYHEDDDGCPTCQVVVHPVPSCTGTTAAPSNPGGVCTGTGSVGAMSLPANGAQAPTRVILTVPAFTHLNTHGSHLPGGRTPTCCSRIDGSFELYMPDEFAVTPCLWSFKFVDPVQGHGFETVWAPTGNSCSISSSDGFGVGLYSTSSSDIRWRVSISLYNMTAWWIMSSALPIVGSEVQTHGTHSLDFYCKKYNDPTPYCDFPATVQLQVS